MAKSHLLLDETPLIVLPSLAKAFGINEAIAIQQIHWVCGVKLEHEDWRTFHDGEMWCSYKTEQWLEKMPWVSDSTCRRMLTGLIAKGILITCKPNATEWNHTKWYRIDYQKLSESEDQNTTTETTETNQSDCTERIGQIDRIGVASLTDSSIYKKEILKREGEKDDNPKQVIAKQPPVCLKNTETPLQTNNPSTGSSLTPESVGQTRTDSVKLLPKRSADLGDLRGKRFDHRAIAQNFVTLFSLGEEQGYYEWAVEVFEKKKDRDPEKSANISLLCLRAGHKATPLDLKMLDQYRKSLISICPDSQQTLLNSAYESLVIEYNKDPSIASLPHDEFKSRYGMSLYKFLEQYSESIA